MKFSENLNYLAYMDHYAREDYVSARHALAQCMEDLRRENTPPDSIYMSDFLRRTGDLHFLEGNIVEAIRKYQLSEQADPDSLLAKYYFAKFLGEKIGDVKQALAKCDLIISLASDHLFEESDEDFSADAYIEMVRELKKSLLNTKAQKGSEQA